jgi:hypothetical protein
LLLHELEYQLCELNLTTPITTLVASENGKLLGIANTIANIPQQEKVLSLQLPLIVVTALFLVVSKLLKLEQLELVVMPPIGVHLPKQKLLMLMVHHGQQVLMMQV